MPSLCCDSDIAEHLSLAPVVTPVRVGHAHEASVSETHSWESTRSYSRVDPMPHVSLMIMGCSKPSRPSAWEIVFNRVLRISSHPG